MRCPSGESALCADREVVTHRYIVGAQGPKTETNLMRRGSVTPFSWTSPRRTS
jgi:hypothetical protein